MRNTWKAILKKGGYIIDGGKAGKYVIANPNNSSGVSVNWILSLDPAYRGAQLCLPKQLRSQFTH